MRLDLLQIAFFLSGFFQFLNGFLALGGVTEVFLFHEFHEILVGGFVNLKAVSGVDALMFAVEFVGVVKNVILGIEVGRHGGIGVTFDFHVGCDAMTFVNGAPAHGLEGLAKAVVFSLSGVLLVRVVNLLNAAATGDVVMRHRNLQLGIVAQRQDILHQSFTKRPLPDDDSAVVVLYGTCYNLTGRSTVAVDKDGERNLKVKRLVGGGIQVIGCGGLTFHGDDGLTLGDKQVDNVHCLVHQAAAVAAQVEDETCQLTVFPHLHKLILQFLGRIACKATQ